MKKSVLFPVVFLFLSLLVATDAFAQKCGSCNGKGKIQTRVATSSYGVSSKKIKCSNCGQWIFADQSHWDVCKTCGGTGQRKKKDDPNPAAGDWMAYLTPAEVQEYYSLRQAFTQPYYQSYACTACNKTGLCQLCKGTATTVMWGQYVNCYGCSATGQCITCKGAGTVTHVTANPNANKIQQRMAELMKIGQQRANRSR